MKKSNTKRDIIDQVSWMSFYMCAKQVINKQPALSSI